MGTINAQYPVCKGKAEAISHLSFHQSLPCQKHKVPSTPGILRVVELHASHTGGRIYFLLD